MNKYKKYIILAVGLIVTILLAVTLLYINKVIFTKDFTAIEGNSSIKLTTNNLIGFSAIIVAFATFILFLNEDSK